MTAALEGGEWSATRLGRTLPSGKTRYPFYGRLGGPQGRSGRAEYLLYTGTRSRTVQPVVSRYTDWATGPTQLISYCVTCQYIYKEGHFKSVILIICQWWNYKIGLLHYVVFWLNCRKAYDGITSLQPWAARGKYCGRVTFMHHSCVLSNAHP